MEIKNNKRFKFNTPVVVTAGVNDRMKNDFINLYLIAYIFTFLEILARSARIVQKQITME